MSRCTLSFIRTRSVVPEFAPARNFCTPRRQPVGAKGAVWRCGDALDCRCFFSLVSPTRDLQRRGRVRGFRLALARRARTQRKKRQAIGIQPTGRQEVRAPLSNAATPLPSFVSRMPAHGCGVPYTAPSERSLRNERREPSEPANPANAASPTSVDNAVTQRTQRTQRTQQTQRARRTQRTQ